MIILEISGLVPVEVLVKLTKENEFEMAACPILKQDQAIAKTRIPAALPLQILNINSISNYQFIRIFSNVDRNYN